MGAGQHDVSAMIVHEPQNCAVSGQRMSITLEDLVLTPGSFGGSALLSSQFSAAHNQYCALLDLMKALCALPVPLLH